MADEDISTHTPLAGRDYKRLVFNGNLCISTHTPLAGRDELTSFQFRRTGEFQLTRPLRGATFFGFYPVRFCLFQLTRPLRGATYPRRRAVRLTYISTHTPLAGRDAM